MENKLDLDKKFEKMLVKAEEVLLRQWLRNLSEKIMLPEDGPHNIVKWRRYTKPFAN